jgi:hypothetical protein
MAWARQAAMTYFRLLALGFALTVAAAPAMAQYSGGGNMGGITPGGGQAPAPQPRTPDIAPPALPGAAPASAPTGPVMQKPVTGDPTAALFVAITKGDDTAAQNALGRGADLNAQNQFGETPLDLSIALNRTSITFLLLQTRNELAVQGASGEPMGAPWDLNANNTNTNTTPSKKPPATHSTVAVSTAPPRVALPANGGTPNAEAGFLGFGPKN